MTCPGTNLLSFKCRQISTETSGLYRQDKTRQESDQYPLFVSTQLHASHTAGRQAHTILAAVPAVAPD